MYFTVLVGNAENFGVREINVYFANKYGLNFKFFLSIAVGK
jgi:hypothetical protein